MKELKLYRCFLEIDYNEYVMACDDKSAKKIFDSAITERINDILCESADIFCQEVNTIKELDIIINTTEQNNYFLEYDSKTTPVKYRNMTLIEFAKIYKKELERIENLKYQDSIQAKFEFYNNSEQGELCQ